MLLSTSEFNRQWRCPASAADIFPAEPSSSLTQLQDVKNLFWCERQKSNSSEIHVTREALETRSSHRPTWYSITTSYFRRKKDEHPLQKSWRKDAGGQTEGLSWKPQICQLCTTSRFPYFPQLPVVQHGGGVEDQHLQSN